MRQYDPVRLCFSLALADAAIRLPKEKCIAPMRSSTKLYLEIPRTIAWEKRDQDEDDSEILTKHGSATEKDHRSHEVWYHSGRVDGFINMQGSTQYRLRGLHLRRFL